VAASQPHPAQPVDVLQELAQAVRLPVCVVIVAAAARAVASAAEGDSCIGNQGGLTGWRCQAGAPHLLVPTLDCSASKRLRCSLPGGLTAAISLEV
jgi:hypothetical protein